MDSCPLPYCRCFAVICRIQADRYFIYTWHFTVHMGAQRRTHACSQERHALPSFLLYSFPCHPFLSSLSLFIRSRHPYPAAMRSLLNIGVRRQFGKKRILQVVHSEVKMKRYTTMNFDYENSCYAIKCYTFLLQRFTCIGLHISYKRATKMLVILPGAVDSHGPWVKYDVLPPEYSIAHTSRIHSLDRLRFRAFMYAYRAYICVPALDFLEAMIQPARVDASKIPARSQSLQTAFALQQSKRVTLIDRVLFITRLCRRRVHARRL